MVTSGPCSRSEPEVQHGFLSRAQEDSKSLVHRRHPTHRKNQVQDHPIANTSIHHRILVHCLLGVHSVGVKIHLVSIIS